jgi:hypothetical protein
LSAYSWTNSYGGVLLNRDAKPPPFSMSDPTVSAMLFRERRSVKLTLRTVAAERLLAPAQPIFERYSRSASATGSGRAFSAIN